MCCCGDFFLDVKNPKLFKKVRKFYENSGVVFSGDPLDDYDMLMDYIASDLEYCGMKVLLERFPYRYVESGTLELNGMPDYRIQKAHHYTSDTKTCIFLTIKCSCLLLWRTLQSG